MHAVSDIASGNVRAAARLIRDIDDGVEAARDALRELYHFTGRASVVGITGSPGVGKSTLVNQLISHLRAEGKTVGVLAVDPSSPFHGGAILGDRIRMRSHIEDEGVFIRSMATRGAFGGLTESTRGAIDVLDAMGKNVIIVETVGVGQDEVDIAKVADTTIVVLMPHGGDEVQAIKAGILEIGDILVVNKAQLPGSERAANDLRMMLSLNRDSAKGIDSFPKVLLTDALEGLGTAELLVEIERHQGLMATDETRGRKLRTRSRVHDRLKELIQVRIDREVLQPLTESEAFELAVGRICCGEVDPYTACDELSLGCPGIGARV